MWERRFLSPYHIGQSMENRPQLLLGKKILLADDSVENQELFSLFLEAAGAIVECVDNGLAAYEKAVKNGYDIILMDMDMPVMTGVEATAKLREAGYSSPIVALTAFSSNTYEETCLEAGCNRIIIKPVSHSILIQSLSDL